MNARINSILIACYLLSASLFFVLIYSCAFLFLPFMFATMTCMFLDSRSAGLFWIIFTCYAGLIVPPGSGSVSNVRVVPEREFDSTTPVRHNVHLCEEQLSNTVEPSASGGGS